MKMSIGQWCINKLSIDRKDVQAGNILAEGTFSLDMKNSFDIEKKRFYVCFDLTLNDPRYDLFTEVVYPFDVIDGEIDEAFIKSHFPRVNAPAIAFPYLRAMISTITLQAGLKPVMLPSINFANAKEAAPIEEKTPCAE